MTPAEIKTEIGQLSKMLKRLSDEGNVIWEERNNLRNEYKRLTGEDI